MTRELFNKLAKRRMIIGFSWMISSSLTTLSAISATISDDINISSWIIDTTAAQINDLRSCGNGTRYAAPHVPLPRILPPFCPKKRVDL